MGYLLGPTLRAPYGANNCSILQISKIDDLRNGLVGVYFVFCSCILATKNDCSHYLRKCKRSQLTEIAMMLSKVCYEGFWNGPTLGGTITYVSAAANYQTIERS